MNTTLRNFVPATSESRETQPHQQHSDEERRSLMRTVWRETLAENGIPDGWLCAESLRLATKGGSPTWHLRFVIREWHPEFLPYMVAAEAAVRTKMRQADRSAIRWFAGISWRFDLPDLSICPELPNAAHWGGWDELEVPVPTAMSPLSALMAMQDAVPLRHNIARSGAESRETKAR